MSGRKQKRRKDFLILSFGVAASLLARIDAAVAEHRKNSRGAALNRSEWIRRAIERDLAHRDRSRGRGKKPAKPATEEGVNAKIASLIHSLHTMELPTHEGYDHSLPLTVEEVDVFETF